MVVSSMSKANLQFLYIKHRRKAGGVAIKPCPAEDVSLYELDLWIQGKESYMDNLVPSYAEFVTKR